MHANRNDPGICSIAVTVAVGGAATFITGASGSDVILDSSGNAFSNAVTASGGRGE